MLPCMMICMHVHWLPRVLALISVHFRIGFTSDHMVQELLTLILCSAEAAMVEFLLAWRLDTMILAQFQKKESSAKKSEF